MEKIQADIEKLQKQLSPPKQTPTHERSASGCKLCEQEAWNSPLCFDCQQKVQDAKSFSQEHCIIPARYKDATTERPLDSFLLAGKAGTGKTWEGYALLKAAYRADPRRKLAACSWPWLLFELRRSYGTPQQEEAYATIAALREADVTFLDDLGAEKVTEGNLGWLQETLYLLLDYRYNWLKITILTTNFDAQDLRRYLGERLASRVLGMCEVVSLGDTDRRIQQEVCE